MTRVLVVDDDRPTVEMLTLALEMEGYEVVTASAGPEALDTARVLQPDLVVLDVMMPGMSGLEVVRVLRRHPDLSTTPVLLLSAWARNVDVWSGWMAGADAYVTKPMDVDDLLEQVSRLLGSGTGHLAS
jgi:two-component system response regulator MtrA